jgi:L-lactate dehydrogenase complex protein LldG
VTAREEVLSRIAAALSAGGAAPAQPVPRAYRAGDEREAADLVAVLTGRLRDYGATVRLVPAGEESAAIAAALAERGVRRLVVPPGLETAGIDLSALEAGVDWLIDTGFSAQELDEFDGVLTTAAVAIAETGTIILDGSHGQGRRALSLIPDYHLCVVRAGQVVGLVPQALPLLTAQRPLTWISGPSATSDIELDRVQGVHGPRTLEVVLVNDVVFRTGDVRG